MKPTISLIRATVGTTMVIYGISQIARPSHWEGYLPDWTKKALGITPVSSSDVMRAHGAANVALGAWYLSGRKPAASNIATTAWWTSILPFAAYYDWRDGLRDLAIIAAIVSEWEADRD